MKEPGRTDRSGLDQRKALNAMLSITCHVRQSMDVWLAHVVISASHADGCVEELGSTTVQLPVWDLELDADPLTASLSVLARLPGMLSEQRATRLER